MLATQGMDRHGAYVALSRHRERTDLYYGKETFKTEPQLIRTLGRDRGKDMVRDYGPIADRAEAFAARRGITLKERIREVAIKVRDMFEGLTLITVCGLLLPICVVIAIHAKLALLSFILFGFGFMFLAMPLVLAPAAIMAITPGRIRGQSGAIYIIFTGIIGGVLGPMLVPLLSDFLFASETAIGRALAYVVAVCAPLGAAIVFAGRPAITAQAEDY